MMISRVRGTRDILDTRLLNFAVNSIVNHLTLHNFQNIVLPILEPVELIKRSLGVETDVVNKELFVVASSSGQSGEEICLRPEATASTARAFVENGVPIVPWKVFSYGSMFRYERPQKGRYREFYQCNIEIIGSASIAQDAQCISMLDQLFGEKFHLQEYGLHINFLGIPEERKVFKEKLKDFLEKHLSTLCDTCKKRKDANTLRVFDCKNEACQTLYKDAPTIIDSLDAESKKEWDDLQNYLGQLSVSFVYNPRLVRGLDYYNKTVFEFVSPLLGSQSAFCGGGRYDTLIKEVGAKEDVPGIGAAIGIDRLLMILEQVQDRISLPYEKKLYMVMPLAQEQHALALQMTDALIRAGFCAQTLFEGSVKSMFRKADKLGAHSVLLLGEQEQKDGTVSIKNMQTSAEKTIKQTEAVSFLSK